MGKMQTSAAGKHFKSNAEIISATSIRKVLTGCFYCATALRYSVPVHSLLPQLSLVFHFFLVRRDSVLVQSGLCWAVHPSHSQICLYLYCTTARVGHAAISYCKFMSNLTLRSLSALLLSRILPAFECLCFKLHFPGYTGLHFPMNATLIFQLHIFNHPTSTFITSCLW